MIKEQEIFAPFKWYDWNYKIALPYYQLQLSCVHWKEKVKKYNSFSTNNEEHIITSQAA